MNGKSLIFRYEWEVTKFIGDLIAAFENKYPSSISGDFISKRFLNSNKSLEFELHSLAVNAMDKFEGPDLMKSKTWQALKDINRKRLIQFANHFDENSNVFRKK